MCCSLCRILIILGHLPADSVRGIQWSQKSRRSPCTRIDCCTAGRRGRGWVSSSGNQMVVLLLFLCHNDCTISDTVSRPGESSLINYFHWEVSTALVWCHWIFHVIRTQSLGSRWKSWFTWFSDFSLILFSLHRPPGHDHDCWLNGMSFRRTWYTHSLNALSLPVWDYVYNRNTISVHK